MEGNKGRKRVNRKKANADPLVYDQNNDIFADCPELNRSNDEGNTTTRSQDDFLLLPVTPSPASASTRLKSRHPAKKSGDHSIDSEYLLTTPKRTPLISFKSYVNNSPTRSGSTSKSKKHVNTENILVQTPGSLTKSSSVFTPQRSEGSTKAILDGYKTLQDIWKRTAKSRRSLLSCAESSPSPNRNLSLFETSASQLQCPTTPLANNLNNSETGRKSQSNAGANSRPSTSREWDEDLPPTQPVSLLILRGVVAYVEVRTGNDNRSMGVKDQLKLLGATVSNTFTKHVTHVVFKEGLLSTYKKAVKRKVPLVSVLWIEECKKAGLKVSERLFPPYDMDRYESPNPLKRIRKMKSIQPDFENGFEKRLIKRNKKKLELAKQNLEKNLILEPVTTDLAAQRERIVGPEWVREAANGNGLVCALVNVANIGQEEFKEIVNRPPTPELSEDECGSSTPLAVRLLRQLVLHKPTTERHSSLLDKISNIEVNRSEIESSNNNNHCIENITETQHFNVGNDSLQNVDKDIETVSHKQIDLMELESSNSNSNGVSSVVEFRQSLDFQDFPSNDSRLHMSVKTNCKPLSINTAILNEKNIVGSFKVPTVHGVCSLNSQTNPTSNEINTNRSTYNSMSIVKSTQQHNTTSNSKTVHGVEMPHVLGLSQLNFSTNTSCEKSVNLSDTKMKKSRKRKLLSLKESDSQGLVAGDLDISSIENPHLNDDVKCKRRRLSKPIPDKTCIPTGVEIPQCVQSCTGSVVNSVQDKKYMNKNRLVEKDIASVQRKSRRSSIDFISTQRRKSLRLTCKSIEEKEVPQIPAIVCTSLHSEEVGVILSVVNTLGGYVVENIVSANTTHVVTNEARRTIKFLKGLARGCWLVKQDWVLKSLEEGKWLDEEEFELIEFSPAVRKYRLEKLSFGPAFQPDLFSKCGRIFVSHSRYPPHNDVIELITLCGGQVVSTLRTAQLIVGQTTHHKGVQSVKVAWVLDSISCYQLEPVERYLVDSQN